MFHYLRGVVEVLKTLILPIYLTVTLVVEVEVKLEGVMVADSRATLLKFAGKWLPM